jgi:hypothetical protein
MNLAKALSSIAFALVVFNASAQKDTTINKIDTSSKKRPVSYFKVGVDYLSDNVYNGRKDSVVVPYITPTFGYYDKSGLFIDVSVAFLANKGKVDLTTIDAGYDYGIGDQITGELSATKYFYSSSSTSVQSQTKFSFDGSIIYDPGFLAFSGGLSVLTSSETDFTTNFSIAHNFTFGEDSSLWTISPTIGSNQGTQKSYAAYKKKRRLQGGGAGSAIDVQNSNNFALLDYEFSLPISYDAKKWGISLTPTYALPQHPVTLTGPLGNVIATENLSNVFYVELGVYFKF